MTYLFYRILNKLGLPKLVNFTFVKYINGIRFKFPIIYSLGSEHSYTSEYWMINTIKTLYKIKSGVFIDVGVNTGQTLIKLKSVAPEVKYIGFEPNPKCIFYVEELIAKNSFANCTLYPVGLMTSTELLSLNFYSFYSTDSSASVMSDFRPDQKVVFSKAVPVFDFSSLTINPASVSLVKIDVEGAESFVILSMLERIKIDRPFILIEILPCYSQENRARIDRQNKIESIVKEIKYTIFRNKKNETTLQVEMIEAIGIHSNMDFCEYLLCPDELVPQIKSYITSL